MENPQVEKPQQEEKKEPHKEIEYGAAKFLVTLRSFLEEWGDDMPEDFKVKVKELEEEIMKRWDFH